MSALAGMTAYLLADTGLKALVGSKIYAGIVPDTVKPPYIRWFRVSNYRPRTKDGPEGAARPRIQFDIYASGDGGYDKTMQIEAALIAAMDTLAGIRGNKQIYLTEYAGGIDGYDDDTNFHYKTVDYFIWHEE